VRVLARHLPQVQFVAPTGGSALWAAAPQGVDTRRVRDLAARRGMLFDAGDVFYAGTRPPLNRFRLGYSSIAVERIDSGIALLAQCFREVDAG
jgi:GntR family transcriptional regulator / MocR family aminotransferase